MPLEHHLVLATDQVYVDHRQTAGQDPRTHDLLALIPLADMKWRRVDDGQQLRASLPRESGRGAKWSDPPLHVCNGSR